MSTRTHSLINYWIFLCIFGSYSILQISSYIFVFPPSSVCLLLPEVKRNTFALFRPPSVCVIYCRGLARGDYGLRDLSQQCVGKETDQTTCSKAHASFR